jgi:glyoxylase I family protein
MDVNLEHLGLAALNPGRLKDWYVQVFNGQVLHATGEPPTFYLSLSGGLILEIYPAEFSFNGTRENTCSGWRHLALRVPSLEAARNELTGRGVTFSDPPRPAGGGGQVLFFRDPEGNLLHLVEREAGSAIR